ncbi:hypothetical protein [Luteimonas sp. FCS-9]|uniref:hypothetical protein n=1 Tax=Luteimonas sp. FCS-9 TaxID=1547516 RepID=UPI00063E7A78|nr:hypothetical protein [Luteimonas sp. FCS-9]KLJ02948.1 hypothetical protein WQ56_01410 [Luteimonas sp. FCS-9]
MTRRLQTPIIACGVSAAALCAGLLFAAPSLSAGDATPPSVAGLSSTTANAAADVAAGEAEPLEAAPRSRGRRGRSAIAMPYFSFARGAGGRG